VVALAADDSSSYDLLTRARSRGRVVDERAGLPANDDRLPHLATAANAFDEGPARSHHRVALRTTSQHRDELVAKRVREG